jgi:hypothetical protein
MIRQAPDEIHTCLTQKLLITLQKLIWSFYFDNTDEHHIPSSIKKYATENLFKKFAQLHMKSNFNHSYTFKYSAARTVNIVHAIIFFRC